MPLVILAWLTWYKKENYFSYFVVYNVALEVDDVGKVNNISSYFHNNVMLNTSDNEQTCSLQITDSVYQMETETRDPFDTYQSGNCGSPPGVIVENITIKPAS